MKDQIFQFSACFTLACVAVSQLAPSLFTSILSPILCVVCIFFLGIPHGALDHFLYFKANLLLRDQSNTPNGNSSAIHYEQSDQTHVIFGSKAISTLARAAYDYALLSQDCMLFFYALYFGLMVGWIALWNVFPQPMFMVFLLLTMYHFGESDMEQASLHQNKAMNNIWTMSRGLYIMSLMFASDPGSIRPIMHHWLDFGVKEECMYRNLLVYGTCQHIIILAGFFAWNWCQEEVTPNARCRYHVVREDSCPNQTRHRKRRSILDSAISMEPSGKISTDQSSPSYDETETDPLSRSYTSEWIRIALYYILFTFVDPLTAFSIYFGIWHSLESICMFTAYLKSVSSKASSNDHLNSEPDHFLSWSLFRVPHNDQHSLTSKDILLFFQWSFPYAVVAWIGMLGIFLAIWFAYVVTADASGIFWRSFVHAISTLTIPHCFIVHAALHNLETFGSFFVRHSR